MSRKEPLDDYRVDFLGTRIIRVSADIGSLETLENLIKVLGIARDLMVQRIDPQSPPPLPSPPEGR